MIAIGLCPCQSQDVMLSSRDRSAAWASVLSPGGRSDDSSVAEERLRLGEVRVGPDTRYSGPRASVFAPCEVTSETNTGDSPGNSFTSRASSRDHARGCLAGVEIEHLAPLGDRLERGHLHRDELRLAGLAMVDAAFDNRDPICDAEARAPARRLS